MAEDSDLILFRLLEMASAFRQLEIVGIFKNGNVALEAILRLKPDLAIIDINMPGISGLRVLKETRKQDQEIKIIILTFSAIDRYREMVLREGADYFFLKAEDFEKIHLVVAEMVREEQRLAMN